LLLLFFSDTSVPLFPNPHGEFELEGRSLIFESDDEDNTRSLILKEGISDGILEMFVLC
jgi:hypothetical protein